MCASPRAGKLLLGVAATSRALVGAAIGQWQQSQSTRLYGDLALQVAVLLPKMLNAQQGWGLHCLLQEGNHTMMGAGLQGSLVLQPVAKGLLNCG